ADRQRKPHRRGLSVSQLLSAVLMLLGFGFLAASAWPPLLHGYGPAFLSTPAGRWSLLSGMFVSFLVSSGIQTHSKKRAVRDAWAEFATRHGGTLKEGAAALPPRAGIRP